MEEYKEVLVLIKKAINTNNLEGLALHLELLPLEMFSQHVLDQFISFFLNNTIEYNNKDAIKVFFDKLYELLPIEVGQLDHITRIFGDPSIDNEALLMVIQIYKQPINYYINILINWNPDPLTVVAARKLAFLYKNTDNSMWRYLFDTTYDILYPNVLLQDYLIEMVKVDSLKVIRPNWIINEYDTIPYEDELFNLIKEPPLLYDLPDDDFAKELINNEDLYNKYVNANDEEKNSIIEPFMLSALRNYLLLDDDKYVKIYGPENTLFNTDLSGNDICSKIGCRMLTCNEFHEDVDIFEEDYYEKVPDWFTGVCDYCFNTIRKRHYACRYPFKNGGFCGCYCSWECVRDDTDANKYIELKLIDIFEEAVNKIGIQDRVYRDDNVSDNEEEEIENEALDELNEKEIIEEDVSYTIEDINNGYIDDDIYNVDNGEVDEYIYGDDYVEEEYNDL